MKDQVSFADLTRCLCPEAVAILRPIAAAGELSPALASCLLDLGLMRPIRLLTARHLLDLLASDFIARETAGTDADTTEPLPFQSDPEPVPRNAAR